MRVVLVVIDLCYETGSDLDCIISLFTSSLLAMTVGTSNSFQIMYAYTGEMNALKCLLLRVFQNKSFE